MFVVNLRLTKRRVALVLGAAAAVVLTIICFAKSGRVSYPDGSELNDRVAYLQKLGYSVKSESETKTDIVIPSDFGGVYKQYNKLQKKAGFNLEEFRKNGAVMYTYSVENFKDKSEVYANLLVHNGKIIGGDISSIENGGFTLPLVNIELNLGDH